MTAAPEVIDHAAREAIAMTQDTLAEVIEAVSQLSDMSRRADMAMVEAITKLAESLGALADRVGMLELDHKRGE